MMLGRLKRIGRQRFSVRLGWRKWQRRWAIGLLTLGLVLGCQLRVTVRATERGVDRGVVLAQTATGQVEPFTIEGRLDSSSRKLEDGSYFNTHTFEGVAGQTVVIDLASEEFDTYLILLDPDGNKIAENDDSDGTNAQVLIQLPSTGTYTILANALEAEATGSYALSLKAATSDDLALAEADRLNQQVLQLYQEGKYAEATPLARQALEMREQILGESHPDTAQSLNNLASLYKYQGRYSEAELLFQRSVLIQEQQLEVDYPLVARSLNNLASVYQDQGRYSEAESLFQRSLSIYERQLGVDHPLVAISLNNLASVYQDQGHYSEAESLFQRSVSIQEQQLGVDHPDIATSLNNLALLYRVQGRYSEAEPLYQRSLSIYEQQLGVNHPDVAGSLTNLALLYFASANVSRGLELINRASAIEETNLALILAVGSEARKQAYVATLSDSTNSSFALHLQWAPDNLEVARLALTTALRRKGRVLDAVSDNLRQLRQNLQPADQPLLDELNSIRAQLGTLLFTGAEIQSPDAYKTQVAALQTRAEELENTLAQRSSEFRVESQPVTLEAVQKLIPADAAVVEIVRYQPFNLKATQDSERWGTPHYAAYVLHPNGDLKWADLGEAEPIDQLVEQFRASLRSQSGNVQTVGRELDAKLMQPIRPLLGNSTHVLLSPDSQLNLIPFAALVDEQNRYLIDTYTFTYFTSGRDLLKLQLDSPSRQAPVLLANPNYDLPGDSETVQIASTSPNPPTSSNRGSDQRSVDLTSLKFGALDGTQQEANAIAPLLPNVTVLTGSRATENALKQLQAPSILHIATHGFFLQDIECVPIPDTRGNTATVIVDTNEQTTCRPTPRNTENPLLRSGLALAGFNPRQSGTEDGVLSALEAAGLNLYGTKLVVMSACETGLGDVANGEGVYGLRRAFVMAGSESQLMSLWKVDDYGTSELMSLYYERIKNAEGRSQALRQVQQEMRAAPAYAHPYYWAGFIFSGDWSPVEKF